MAVGFVASASSGSQASVASFNIGTLGTGARAGIVFVATHGTGDLITGVTWNGVAMTRLYRAADTDTEPGSVVAYFLDNVTNGTVAVSRTNNAVVTVGYAASISAAGVTQAWNTITRVSSTQNTNADTSTTGTGASGEVAVDDGSPGTNSMRFAAAYTGAATPVAQGTNSTSLQSLDSTALGSSFVRETTAGQGSRSVGFATGTTDDWALVAVVVREQPAGATGTGAGTQAAATASGSGTETFTGTGAGTGTAATASGSAAETFSGTGAGTGTASTASGSGLLLNGTGAGTQAQATASGTGEQADTGPTGTGAGTQAIATASGAGTETMTGTGAGTGTAASGSGAATETFTGTGAGTGQASTASGAAVETFSGTGAGTQAAATASGSGLSAIPVTGTGAGTQAAATASGAGLIVEAVTGTGAGVQGPATASGTGTGGVDASPDILRHGERLYRPMAVVTAAGVRMVRPTPEPRFSTSGAGVGRRPSGAGRGDVNDDELVIGLLEAS